MQQPILALRRFKEAFQASAGLFQRLNHMDHHIGRLSALFETKGVKALGGPFCGELLPSSRSEKGQGRQPILDRRLKPQ